jgi:hypothetical protein
MPFAEESVSYDNTRKRTSAAYLKFSPEYKAVVRILNPEAKRVWKHWIQAANGGKGMYATCPNVGSTGICPIEKQLAKLPKDDPRILEGRAKKKFMVNILDRTPYTRCPSCETLTPGATSPTTSGKVCISCQASLKGAEFAPLNRVKIIEGGPKLFAETLNAVQKMQLDDLNKEITEYDITLVTQGVNRDRKIAAFPQPPEDLDDSVYLDPETGEPQALYDLDLLAEPATPEEIEALLKGATMLEINALRGITE